MGFCVENVEEISSVGGIGPISCFIGLKKAAVPVGCSCECFQVANVVVLRFQAGA